MSRGFQVFKVKGVFGIFRSCRGFQGFVCVHWFFPSTRVKFSCLLVILNLHVTKLTIVIYYITTTASDSLYLILHTKLIILNNSFLDISEETQAKVDELLERNKNLLGQERELSDEIPPLFLNEPEYLVWEYNPSNPNYKPGRYPTRVPEV